MKIGLPCEELRPRTSHGTKEFEMAARGTSRQVEDLCAISHKKIPKQKTRKRNRELITSIMLQFLWVMVWSSGIRNSIIYTTTTTPFMECKYNKGNVFILCITCAEMHTNTTWCMSSPFAARFAFVCNIDTLVHHVTVKKVGRVNIDSVLNSKYIQWY